MLTGVLFLALIYLCQGYMNPRLQNWLQETRHNRFLPAAAGIGIGSGPRPGSQLRRQAQDDRQPPDNPNHDNTYFCPMPGMEQSRATLVQDEREYKWIARVIHRGYYFNSTAPMICTAAGIRYQIFITAARCIATAKPLHTSLRVQSITLAAKSFVTPSPSTKQLFDDIGIIVTWAFTRVDGVKIYSPKKDFLPTRQNPRTAEGYWFQDWAAGASYKVVGYIAPEDSPSNQNLYELGDMYGSNSLCNKIFPMEDNTEDYWAACVHSCDALEHSRNSATCHRYLFGLGHVVLDKDGELIGIVTWTCGNSARDRASREDLPLPVGVAVPDARFKPILDCAHMLARDHNDGVDITPGYFPSFCK